MKRLLVVTCIAVLALFAGSANLEAQSVTETGHASDGWSHRCSSSSECDARYQWHMKCVHGQGRSIPDCDSNFPGSPPMVLTAVTVVVGMGALGAGGGALLALAQDASVDPNASLEEQKATPYLTYMAGGAAAGSLAGLFGLGMAKAPKAVGIYTGITLATTAIAVGGAKSAHAAKPYTQRIADEESGKAKRDERKAALIGLTAGAVVSTGVLVIPELAGVGEFSLSRNLRQSPGVWRATVRPHFNPFGVSRLEVVVR